MKNTEEKRTILGEEYTYDQVDWSVQTGYPVEHGRMSHSAMIMGLWHGDEFAISEMREYMESHEFKHLTSAGRIYHRIMDKLHPMGMDNVTDARLVYEAILQLPVSEEDREWREEVEQLYGKYIATIRRNRARKTIRKAA